MKHQKKKNHDPRRLERIDPYDIKRPLPSPSRTSTKSYIRGDIRPRRSHTFAVLLIIVIILLL